MSPIKSSTSDNTRKKINATNYKKALNALEQSNFDKFVPLKTNKEILKMSLGTEINSDKFFDLITALFQSMTTQGYTTFEIVNFIASELNKFKNPTIKAKVIEFLERSYTIVHSDYQGKLKTRDLRNVSRILFALCLYRFHL